ncbi:urease accessory protein UreF [Conexibacter woesei]|uniref:Urease accessory protein UreF n=1 Tax=Conexibacter woesei (strain DSM 14684 / CCUG 47730 / CIP 108061 / JCM 11494 / NBRC 100937 / ID131577) TaxID=469383 RepID=D3EZF8_CONWI|nr:urease accessory UreF family protein [Conexibacter woesei]ADB51923.1 Urease accessory protein UreF [Conexibacter woesei DSM 14684]
MSTSVLSLLLADSRTPLGGYAHSGGLEAAVESGLGAGDVQAFAAARLATVARVDAAFAAAACDVRQSAPPVGVQTAPPPVTALLTLDDELAARTASAPLRAAARQLGRALLRVGQRLRPDDPTLSAYLRESGWTPRPVAFGVLAGATGLAPVEAARLVLYEDVAGVAAAAVKLLPLDAADATAWVAELAPRIATLAESVAAGRPPAHSLDANRLPPAPPAPHERSAREPQWLPATSTPFLDLRSLDHDRSDGRLFVT